MGGFDGLDKGPSAHSKVVDAQHVDARVPSKKWKRNGINWSVNTQAYCQSNGI